MSKKIKILILIILLSLISIIFVYHDDFLYSKTIMKITKIETVRTDIYENTLGLQEKYYIRKIYGVITNGERKGEEVTLNYEETFSSVVTDKYKVGDKAFISSSGIEDLKRDVYVTIMITIFVLFMYMVGQFRGLLAIWTVIFNSFIFYFGLNLYFDHVNLIFICIVESVIFTILSLLIANGINKKTISAILSVFASLSILIIILLLLIQMVGYSSMNFNGMSFLAVPFEEVFLPELFIGCLGAIMDVAITMSSSIRELIDKNPEISSKTLKESGKEIGKDIMSTMINVLFFTYLCSGLPIFVLALRNGFSMYNYITTNFTLEVTRFLAGSIGIVLTIPISIFISVRILKRGEIHE